MENTKKNYQIYNSGFVASCFYEDNLLGMIAIDKLVNGKAAGGIRAVQKIDSDELKALAFNQTLKHAFLGISLGGAKGAVIINPKDNLEVRNKKMKLFGTFFSSILTRSFLPGMDTGLKLEDMALIMDGTGYRHDTRKWKNKSHIYTAYSLFATAKKVINMEFKKYNTLDKKTVIIEGLGEVGVELLKLLSKHKIKLVGVSTIQGGLINKEGLDINEIVFLRKKYGDSFVNYYKNDKKVNKSEILYQKADILFQCALPYSITKDNCSKIKSDIIIPAANIPITKDALDFMYKKGILVIPNYISNSGGVFGSNYDSKYDNRTMYLKIESYLNSTIEYLLKESKVQSISLTELSEIKCLERFEKLKKKSENNLKNKILMILDSLHNRITNTLIDINLSNPGFR